MQLNYFKKFDELTEDFKRLSLKDQSQELNEIMSNYSSLARDDTAFCGQLTAQTTQTKRLYDILRYEHEKRLDETEEL